MCRMAKWWCRRTVISPWATTATQSLDSRYWGFVPRENIIGKPLIIYWSYDAPTEALSNPAVGIDHLIDLRSTSSPRRAGAARCESDSRIPGAVEARLADAEPALLRPDPGRAGAARASGRAAGAVHAKQVLNVVGARSLIQATPSIAWPR
jgi:hypothetical protein